jgi:type IV secretory pathway VirB2 component (pilin)
MARLARLPRFRFIDAAGKRPLQKILQSIEGQVAKIIAVIIIVTSLTLAFGDTSGDFSRRGR